MDWQAVDTIDCLPNYAPVIKDIEGLKKEVESAAERQLLIFIDGKKTIRELAIVTPQEPIAIALTLAPHVKSKALAMQQVEDLQLTNSILHLQQQLYPSRKWSTERIYSGARFTLNYLCR